MLKQNDDLQILCLDFIERAHVIEIFIDINLMFIIIEEEYCNEVVIEAHMNKNICPIRVLQACSLF